MQRSPRAFLAVLAVVSVASWTAHTTRLDSQHHYLATQRYEDVYYLPPPAWLKVFSLGYAEATAGLVWMRALVYFGDELAHRGEVANLFHYADALLALDPKFQRVYRWIATCAVYRTGRVGVEHVRKGIDYLERAARLWPDDGAIAWDLASFYLYELRPLLPDEESKLEARRKGIEHLKVATLRGAGPPWLALTAAAELERLGQREQEVAFLQEMYGQVSDEGIREQLAQRIARLQTASYTEAMERARTELEAQRARDFPYLPAELFLHVGPKPAFDGTALLMRGFDPAPEVEDAASATQAPR